MSKAGELEKILTHGHRHVHEHHFLDTGGRFRVVEDRISRPKAPAADP